MNSKKDQKSKTDWLRVIGTCAAAGVIAVGGTLAAIKLYEEKNQLFETLEKNTTECDDDFIEAKHLTANVGDLIEIKRELLYSHWTIFVGNGNVIHLVDYMNGKAKVLCEKLEKVAQNNLCRVNNLVEAANRRRLRAKSEKDIKETALKMLNKVVDYDVLSQNCEHFATFCRYGLGFSEQSLATSNTPIIRSVAPHIARSIQL